MKKIKLKNFKLNKIKVSKLDTQKLNKIFGGSRTTVDFNSSPNNNC